MDFAPVQGICHSSYKRFGSECRERTYPDDRFRFGHYHIVSGIYDTVRAVRIQRGVFAQGDNAWVDHYSFNASAPATDKTYPVVFTSGKMLKKYPEAYTDVRGQVTADYQTYLEKVWIKALNRKYPVVIYKDNLKTVNAQ